MLCMLSDHKDDKDFICDTTYPQVYTHMYIYTYMYVLIGYTWL